LATPRFFELANGLQLDLWFAHADIAEKKDLFGVVEKAAQPCNFGMLYLARTGSVAHNLYLCSHASWMGLHFAPHAGITRAGKVIASATEADIFAALKLDFVAPERRER
jgi:DNA polymerase/3'-5' exonuclease PolX